MTQPTPEPVTGSQHVVVDDAVTMKFTNKSLATIVVVLLGVLGVGGTGALLNRTDDTVKADIKEMKEALKILPVIQAQLVQTQTDRARADKLSDDHESRLRTLEQLTRNVRAPRTPGE